MGIREFIHIWLTSKIHDDAILFGYQVFWWAGQPGDDNLVTRRKVTVTIIHRSIAFSDAVIVPSVTRILGIQETTARRVDCGGEMRF